MSEAQAARHAGGYNRRLELPSVERVVRSGAPWGDVKARSVGPAGQVRPEQVAEEAGEPHRPPLVVFGRSEVQLAGRVLERFSHVDGPVEKVEQADAQSADLAGAEPE